MVGVLVALVLAAASAEAPTRVAVAECLGTERFALNLERLAELRAKAAPEAWTAACRQARETDGARKALAEKVLAAGEAPAPSYRSAARFASLARQAEREPHATLFRRAALDQVARGSLHPGAKALYAPGLTPLAGALLDGLISAEGLEVDAGNRAWLADVVAKRGWFSIRRDGADADHAAWFLAQHGDEDRAYQRAMIEAIRPLAEAGDSSANRYAFLYDRWAAGADRPQRFGISGRCVRPGVWEPRPIEEPGTVDARRAWAGLKGTLAEQVAERSATCR